MRMIATAALLAGAATLYGCTMDDRPKARANAEVSLAAALEGYSAGPTTSCVNSRDLQGNRSYGDAILFDGVGGRVFVNRPSSCPRLGPGQTLRVRSVGARMCSGDFADVVDLVSGVNYGGCALGEFTEYRRR